MRKFLKFDIIKIFLYIYCKLNIMEKIILEIKSAEGGSDSKLLVKEMAEIYRKTAVVYLISI
jgi:protein subunit release factor A